MSHKIKKKAYLIREPDEGRCSIVFHHHGLAAKRIGSSDLDCEFTDTELERCKQYDQFNDLGYVPPRILIGDGWWFHCYNCGVTISEDSEDVNLDDIVCYGSEVIYCSTDCIKASHKEKAKFEECFLEFKLLLREEYPKHIITKIRGGWPSYTFTADIWFPGASYCYNEIKLPDWRKKPWALSVNICRGDLDAYEAWVKDVYGHKVKIEAN